MRQIEQRKSMLELVRRSCEGADKLSDFEGTYEPEPEQVKAWQEAEASDFGGMTRFLNLAPQEVRRRLAVATDPEEVKALKVAESMWAKNGGFGSGLTVAGTVDRGEPRQAIRAKSMRELTGGPRVAYVTVSGSLRAGGVPSEDTIREPGSIGRLADMIDWDALLSMGPAPEPVSDSDWF